MKSITAVDTKVPKAKVYPREIVQALKELEAIQPPPGFAEYQQRVHRAEQKLEEACKKYGINSLRVILDLPIKLSVSDSGTGWSANERTFHRLN
jgi:hypothetical protein